MQTPCADINSADLPLDWSGSRTVRDVLRAAQAYLAAAGAPDAAVDARHLAVHALGIDRAALLRDPDAEPDAAALDRFAAVLRRRATREPVARIIGKREFYGLILDVGAATLDPRPDTETVVSVALHLAGRMSREGDHSLRILDLGTGTGAIALALLAALPAAEAVATDIHRGALEIARSNAVRHGLADRVLFVPSDWLDEVEGQYHLVVANPPYIPTDQIADLAIEVAEWEPRAALDGGPDGLDAYRAILASADRVLAPGGWLVFEVGYGQDEQVAELAFAHGFVAAPPDWPMLRDIGGKIRCVAVATPHCDNKKTLGIEVRSV